MIGSSIMAAPPPPPPPPPPMDWQTTTNNNNNQQLEHRFQQHPPPPPPPQSYNNQQQDAIKPLYHAIPPPPPLPPPPPPTQQKVVQFQPDLGMSYSFDSSSNANSSITTISSNVKDLNALSPKLQSFFNRHTNNSHGTNHNTNSNTATDRRSGYSNSNSNSNNPLFMSPETQCLDETNDTNYTTDTNYNNDYNNEEVLHSIFSPDFKSKSSKKKRLSEYNLQQQQEQQQHNILPFNPMFSPVSTTSNNKSFNNNNINEEEEEDDGTTNISEMSDTSDYSTIHAILRGDNNNNTLLLQNMKKSVGLDDANHPLKAKKKAMGQEENQMVVVNNGNSNSNNNMNNHGIKNISSDAVQQQQQSTNAMKKDVDSIGDSTADMLDKARFLASNSKQMLQQKQQQATMMTAVPIQQNGHTSTTTPDNNYITQQQQPTQQPVSSTKKTPRVSPTPSDDDEFYTPTSIQSSSSATNATTPVNYDIGRMLSNSTGLEPVYEENGVINESNETTTAAAEQDDSPINMDDFRTPKQQHNWNDLNDYSNDEGEDHDVEEEEEFFSPLAQHAVHTPKQHDVNNNSINNDTTHHNFLLGSTLTLDFNVDDLNNKNNTNLSVTREEVPSSDMPPVAATAVRTKTQPPPTSSSSPRFKEMKQGLQSLLKVAKEITSPEKEQPVVKERRLAVTTTERPSSSAAVPALAPTPVSYYAQSPNDSQSSIHLHSSSVSSLPFDALTVDFVKSCNCIETLTAILSLLSSDDNNNHHHRNHGKKWGGGKKQMMIGKQQVRYPSLVRLVEKRLQRMQKEQQHVSQAHDVVENELAVVGNKQPVQVRPKVVAASRGGKVLLQPLSVGGSDKENVDPSPRTAAVNELPMESITVLHESNEGGNNEEGGDANDQSISPLLDGSSNTLSASKSSLDMNLSQSFALDDESHYWKAIGNEMMDDEEAQQREIEEHVLIQQKAAERNGILQSYEEVKDKLAFSLVSNAQLTGEVDSLFQERNEVKAELSSKLQCVSEQLSRQQSVAAYERESHQQQIVELDGINRTLSEDVQRLQHQLHRVSQEGEAAASHLQAELEEVRIQHSNLSRDNATLCQDVQKIRERYDKAQREVSRLKLLLNKKNATPEKEISERLQRIVESAKMANKALANALAVSEKDLADAYEAKDKSTRECDTLRDRNIKLEDKTSFLSSKVKELYTELKSSHAYIDQLYADLQANKSPSKAIHADLERKEMEWMELERGYSKRIQELEGQLQLDSKHKVTMEAYMSVVKQTRHYKNMSIKLKVELEAMKKSQVTNSGERGSEKSTSRVTHNGVSRHSSGKSMRSLQSIQMSNQQAALRNDENTAPSSTNARERSLVTAGRKQGKQINRVAAIRAAGGRKGLSEQLKRARHGEKKVPSK